MKTIPDVEIERRIRAQNPWWDAPHEIPSDKFGLPKRAYFELLYPHVIEVEPRRALVLMGPRRVGKTVMLFQAIAAMIESGIPPNNICYVDLQVPLYNRRSIESLLQCGQRVSNCDNGGTFYMFVDEIQYLPNWEMHLKNAVDEFGSNVKFIVSGSAAAALKLKSDESGAGRFTDFFLPPVTFYEFLTLTDRDQVKVTRKPNGTVNISWDNTELLNAAFIDYLNYGGYPEALFSAAVRANAARYIGSDIIEKVLLKDLPSLYGIHDVQELNSLFNVLAYNTSNEVSLDSLSKTSGVAKNTIKKYITYLESAFLIKVLNRVDMSAKKFARANFFKVYLANPCMRSALFSPVSVDDEAMGAMAETAVVSQWFHSTREPLFYSRWTGGEVDLVRLSEGTLKPEWVVEIKWSDRIVSHTNELKSLTTFLKKHPDCPAKCTTISIADMNGCVQRSEVEFWPTAVYSYYVGYNVIRQKGQALISVSF